MTIDLNEMYKKEVLKESDKNIDKTMECIDYLRKNGWMARHDKEMMKMGELEALNNVINILFGNDTYKVIHKAVRND